MSGDHQYWLSKLSANKRGGFGIKPIDRGMPYYYTLDFAADVSSDTFKMALRAAPVSDPTATPALVYFSVTVGIFADGVTPVTFSLSETDVEDPAKLPADSGDGVATLYWDILHTPSGGVGYRMAAGFVEILGGVADNDV